MMMERAKIEGDQAIVHGKFARAFRYRGDERHGVLSMEHEVV